MQQILFASTAGRTELNKLAVMFGAGHLVTHTMQPTYKLSQIVEALTRMSASGVLGKIGIEIE